jgi:hypothetical protein
MRGLADVLDPSGFTDAPTGVYTSNDPIAVATPVDPLLTDESGSNCLASMFVNGQCPQSADPSLLFGMGPVPNTTPLAPLTPAELAAEQSRASAWLATIPGALSTASKVAALTTAQIAAGLQAGALKPSSTCPSGYMLAGSAQCAGASTSGAPLIAGISNTTLGIAAVVFLALMLMGKKR